MKKVLVLFMLVFGINTAVQAQTRIELSDENGVVVETLESEKTLTPGEVSDLFEDLRTRSSERTVAGSFRLDVWWQYAEGRWSHEYGEAFNWYEGETFADIMNRIIIMFDL